MGLFKGWLRGRHERRHHRLQSCSECLLQQRRERQYLERLRGAEIPRASDDLTARLLARTEQLAAEQPAASPGTRSPAPNRGPLRTALVAGGVAAAATLMAGSAYVMGGDTAPPEAGGASSAFLKQDLPVGEAASGAAGGTAGTGWSLTGGLDLTPAGALTTAQLNGLRSQGWTCPELRELGYHLVWAKGGVAAGGDILELRLTDGQHFATVLEQHGLHEQPSARIQPQGSAGVQQASAATAPVNVLTGHSAAADGFSPATLQGMGLPAAGPGTPSGSSGEGTLWINAAAPFRAIYETPSGTFTYVSDQPAGQADEGVAAIVRAGTASPAGPAAAGAAADGRGGGTGDDSADVVTARMERGLGRILELLAP